MRRSSFDPKEFYDYDEESNTYEIRIYVRNYLDIYHGWDFNFSRKRDLQGGLFDQLMASSREIPRRANLRLHFHIKRKARSSRKEKITREVLENYLYYRIHHTRNQSRKTYRQAAAYAFSGFLFLLAAYLLQQVLLNHLTLKLIRDGIFIGGWVLFWEAFHAIFFRLTAFRDDLFHLYRLERSNVQFHYSNKGNTKKTKQKKKTAPKETSSPKPALPAETPGPTLPEPAPPQEAEEPSAP